MTACVRYRPDAAYDTSVMQPLCDSDSSADQLGMVNNPIGRVIAGPIGDRIVRVDVRGYSSSGREIARER